MNKLTLNFSTLIVLVLIFTSCEILDLFEPNRATECDFIYPIILVMPDHDVLAVSNNEEIETAFKDWRTSNPLSPEEPTFEYPFEVLNDKGETVTVENDEELKTAFANCEGVDPRRDCFEFIYPISMLMPDSTMVTGDDAITLKTAIDDWYDANPNATENPTYVYPITIAFENNTTQVIDNDTELESVYDNCR